MKKIIVATLGAAFFLTAISGAETVEGMRWTDTSRGKSIAKDPSVIHFKDRYLMYYSVPPFDDKRPGDSWAIGIAESRNLTDWRKVGELAAFAAMRPERTGRTWGLDSRWKGPSLLLHLRQLGEGRHLPCVVR